MIKSTLRLGAVLFGLLAMTISSQAQNEVWTEDFAGGIPSGWTSNDASGAGGVWTWCNDPVNAVGAGCVSAWATYVNQHGAFASATGANGFMVMDSDGLGSLTNPPHVVRLTSTPIDCSTLSEVWVKAESLIGVWEYPTLDNAVLRVSTDGTNWTPFNLFNITTGASNPGTVRWTNNPGVSLTDISSVAAGQSTVYLQWSWTGNYEYYWLLDDVVMYDGDPSSIFFAAHDMQVNSNFAAVAPNLFWPLSQAETFGFLADIVNVGLQEQTNVVLNISIEDPNATVVYTEDLNYGSIPPDSLAENVPFAGAGFLPTELGVYTGTYTISADSTDENTDNNTVSFEFLMTDSLFSKENGASFITRPADASWSDGEPWSWAYGNYYFVKDAGDYMFSHVFFAIEAVTALAGENVTVKVYEWVDSNEDEQADPSERTAVATMLYTITGTELGDEILSIPVTTLLGDPVALKNNTQYIVMVEFQTDAAGNTIEMGMSDAVDYGAMVFRANLDGAPRYGSFLGVLGNLDDEAYSSLGFGYDFVPVVRVSFLEPSSAKDLLQLKGNLSVFPNPANTEVSLGMEFNEMMKDVTIQLFDINGRLIESRRMDNVTKQQTSFNTGALTNGTYVFKVTTEQGTRSERFSVQR